MKKQDYNFLDIFGPVELGDSFRSKNKAEGKNAKIDFMDANLPASFDEGQELIDMVRERVEKGDKGIDDIGKQVDSLQLKTEPDMALATEMQGRIKDLKSRLKKAVEPKKDYYYRIYKQLLGILNVRINKLDKHSKRLQKKQDNLAHMIAMEQRRKQQEAEAEARKLQERLDAEARAQEKKELAAAKAERRAPVKMPRIVVDKPVIERTVKVKTESASTTIETYLSPTIDNLGSKFILQMVLNYYRPKYLELAEKALNAAIKAGVLGLKGADGVRVEEKQRAKNIKRR